MPNLTVSSDLDALLAKQTLAEAKTYLGVTANETAITAETTRATAAEGVNATDIATNATDIATNATDIATNAADIATNATDIATNATDIATNATDIATNAADIATNAADIATNATDIATNATAISTETTRATAAEGQLSTDIATNDWEISRNATNIATNTAAISTNATDIATETTRATSAEGQLNTAIAAEISRAQTAEQGNATDIATNVTDIATNAGNIASNAIRGINNQAAISTETTRALAAEALLAPIDNATFTGTTTIPSADITTADFNAGATGGELSWNNQERTLDLVTGADTTIQVGQELVLYATNASGATIPNGSVVAISGSQGNKPTIVLAQADTVENARKTIGVVTQVIPNNSNGFVTLNGKVRNLVLDGGTFTEGEVVYLSSTVAGGITNIQPDISVELGHVLATSTGGNTSGVLEVQINNETSVYELKQQVPHNSDLIIICNDGDNIQDKYDEAVALATGGLYGYADLLVMSGTYSGITGTGNNNVSIIGVGNRNHIEIGSITLDQNYGLIENVSSEISITSNYADIKGVYSGSSFYMLENYGDIINCSASQFLGSFENYGLVEGCESRGLLRGFGGSASSLNDGTIKNCTASGQDSFGKQGVNGVTENCTGVNRSFAATSSNASFVRGTYKNCKGGNNSFFGINTDTSGVRTIEATYIDCTAGNNSFGFVNFVGAETQFAGSALNCTSGDKGFAAAGTTGGTSKIINGAIIENCVAGSASFGTFNGSFGSYNEGAVLRCRTTEIGATPFSATGTGIVRLCLDGNFNEVNLG